MFCSCGVAQLARASKNSLFNSCLRICKMLERITSSVKGKVVGSNPTPAVLKKNVPHHIRIEVIKRDDNTCTKCGCKVKPGKKRNGLALAIVVRIVHPNQGGTNDLSNLKTLCLPCGSTPKKKKNIVVQETIKPVAVKKKRRKTSPLSKKLRKEVFSRDGYTCYLCSRRVKRTHEGGNQEDGSLATVDHLIPRSKGGTDDIDNLKTCCYDCNQIKADRLVGHSAGYATVSHKDGAVSSSLTLAIEQEMDSMGFDSHSVWY